jgi:hypothetical protein
MLTKISPLREQRVRSFIELKKLWNGHAGSRHFHPAMVIKEAGLLLRADTILVPMGKAPSGAKTLAVEADQERLLTLLGVAYRRQVPTGLIKHIASASKQWQRGEKALAHIHLAFAGLPRLERNDDVYRLYLGGALLDDGLKPREMLKELGLDPALCLLAKYAPDQPRVPAGNGRESGRWTKEGDSASTADGADRRLQLAGDVIHVGVLVGDPYPALMVKYPGRHAITSLRSEILH